jgi:hypothetical protein
MKTPLQKRFGGLYASLFFALLLLLVLYPYFGGGTTRTVIFVAIVLATHAAAVYAASGRRRTLVISLVLMGPAVLGALDNIVGVTIIHPTLGSLSAAAFYMYTLVIIAWDVFTHEKVTENTLFGAACIYLLVGFAFTFLYYLVEKLNPGAFDTASAAPADWPTFLYYSFVTMTTLGYGEVRPLSDPARSLAIVEATFGVLFTAILVARLIGLYQPGRAPGDDQTAG